MRGCDAEALASTENPLLVTPEVSPLPTWDSTRLVARAALEVAIGRHDIPTWRSGARHGVKRALRNVEVARTRNPPLGLT